MTEINDSNLELVSGGYTVRDLGYDVGYGAAYVVSGNAGRDLGAWLYEKLN
ncbi:hypothetical protein PN836_000425 [Ningiella sp. W23]|uniref:hypothetical protein n=1 Tax=Ningiella sp. W23 TaxID=3023715 RepID=UPI003757F763